MLVHAPGGFGKSALLAQLVDRVFDGRWVGEPPALACFFVRADGARNTAIAFLQAANAQLLAQLGLPGGTPPGATELRGQFSELWSEAVRRATITTPLLLVVDGLDEMADEDITIADLLPSALADHVHVVVSSRAEPDPRDMVGREHPLRTADTLDLRAFGEDGVRLLIAHFGLDEAEVSATRILALTRGEPLFVRFVCEAIASRGVAELNRLEHDPPRDAEGYFRDQLRDLDEADLGNVTWQVLGALVVAYGGMTEDELAEVLEQPRRTLRGALRPVRRFLINDDCLSLFHRSLSDLVAGEFTASELTGLRTRMMGWCQEYAARGWPADTPRYILDHCSEHYSSADRTAAIALPDRAWLNRHRQATGAAVGFIRDVEVALKAAAGDVSNEVRLCLIGGNAVAMASTVPAPALRVLACCGAAGEARARAGLAAGQEQRATNLTEVGRGLAANGDNAHAREVLAAAAEELAGAPFKFDAFVPAFLGLADAVADDADLLHRLLDVARSMDWAEDRATCIGRAAGGLRALGDVAVGEAAVGAAMEAARATGDLHGAVLAALAVAAGDAGAADHLDSLDAQAARTLELAGVAEGWARAGDPERGAAAGRRLAEVCSRADTHELSRAVLRLEHPSLRDDRQVLGVGLAARVRRGGLGRWGSGDDIVRAFAALGDAGMLAQIEAMVDDEHNDWYGALAEGYARLGDGPAALGCLRRMALGDGSMIDAAVPSAAAALVAAGYLDDARELAGLGVYSEARAAAMALVAAALLDAGDGPAALEAARHAIGVAESIEDFGASGAFGALACAIAEAGDSERAAVWAEHARGALQSVLPGARTTVEPVVDALVQCGRLEAAMDLADGEYPDLVLIAKIAVAFADAGDVGRATALAERVLAEAQHSFERIPALFLAADAFRHAGADDRAQDCVTLATPIEPEDLQYRGKMLVNGLRDAGLPAAAVTTARALAGRSDTDPGVAAHLLAAAGLAAEAAERARAALALPDDDDTIGDPVSDRAALAALLPPQQAFEVLQGLRTDAARVPDAHGRAAALVAIASALHGLDAAAAGATLRDAFLAAWIGGRPAVMDTIVNGPVADLGTGLPAQMVEWIREVDAWWGEQGIGSR